MAALNSICASSPIVPAQDYVSVGPVQAQADALSGLRDSPMHSDGRLMTEMRVVGGWVTANFTAQWVPVNDSQ